MPVDLSWQMAVMDIVVQNQLFPHMVRFKVEAQEHFGIWALNFSFVGVRECTGLIKELNELKVKKEHHFQKLI